MMHQHLADNQQNFDIGHLPHRHLAEFWGSKIMINISEHAAYVHRLVNVQDYEGLLVAFQTAAKVLGFEFVEGTKLLDISSEVRDSLGTAVILARIKHMAPRMLDSEHQRYALSRAGDGESENWTDTILSALQKRGIVLAASNLVENDKDPETTAGPVLHSGGVSSNIHNSLLVQDSVSVRIEGKESKLSLEDSIALHAGLADAIARVSRSEFALRGSGLTRHTAVLDTTGSGVSGFAQSRLG